MSEPPRTTSFRTTLGSDPAEAGVARTDFVRWMTAAGVDGVVAEELAVVFSELAANAANASTAPDPTEVSAWTEPDSVVLEVRNHVTGGARHRRNWDLHDPLRSGGRGLMIVRAYTDDIAFQAVGDTIRVRCRRLLTR